MSRDPNVVSLQNAINRFAPYAGFAAIGVDGGVGTETAHGLLKSLAWIQQHIVGAEATAAELTGRAVLDSGAYNYTQIQTSASGFATYLNQNANAAALPVAPAPTVATSGGGGGGAQASLPALNPAGIKVGLVANVGNAWRGLPTWGKVMGGLLAGLGVIWGVNAVRRHKSV